MIRGTFVCCNVLKQHHHVLKRFSTMCSNSNISTMISITRGCSFFSLAYGFVCTMLLVSHLAPSRRYQLQWFPPAAALVAVGKAVAGGDRFCVIWFHVWSHVQMAIHSFHCPHTLEHIYLIIKYFLFGLLC